MTRIQPLFLCSLYQNRVREWTNNSNSKRTRRRRRRRRVGATTTTTTNNTRKERGMTSLIGLGLELLLIRFFSFLFLCRSVFRCNVIVFIEKKKKKKKKDRRASRMICFPCLRMSSSVFDSSQFSQGFFTSQRKRQKDQANSTIEELNGQNFFLSKTWHLSNGFI